MNSQSEIPLPPPLRSFSQRSPFSDELHVYPTIRLQSIYARCRRTFGSWDAALIAANLNPLTIKKKVAAHDPLDVIKWFDDYDQKTDSNWTHETLKKDDLALYQALRNNLRVNSKDRRLPYSCFSKDYLLEAWVNLCYWRNYGQLSFDEDWFNKNLQPLTQEHFEIHRGQETWSLEKIQNRVLRLYADGAYFSRSEIETSAGGGSLLAALRSDVHGVSGKSEKAALKKVGVLGDELFDLEKIISDTPLEDVLSGFRTLVGETCDYGENRLSREYVERNHAELFAAANRWHKRLSGVENAWTNWSSVLRFFGLNPNIFELQAKKKARRGFAFQRFFTEFLRQYLDQAESPQKVTTSASFCADRLLPTAMCSHQIQCKPDFYFKDMIIDTKVGGALAKPEQLQRYLDHKARVVIVTINDQNRTHSMDNGVIEIIRFKDFIAKSMEFIGVQAEDRHIDELSTVLTSIELGFDQ